MVKAQVRTLAQIEADELLKQQELQNLADEKRNALQPEIDAVNLAWKKRGWELTEIVEVKVGRKRQSNGEAKKQLTPAQQATRKAETEKWWNRVLKNGPKSKDQLKPDWEKNKPENAKSFPSLSDWGHLIKEDKDGNYVLK